MTDEARALIAEGRKHDEAMTDGPWDSTHDIRHVDVVGPLGIVCRVNLLDDDATDEEHINARGIAWLRTNLASLLTGYASALDEVARLTQLASDRYEEAEELHAMHGDATQTARPTIAALRAEVGELKLVIEQQDRDAERFVAGLREALEWATPTTGERARLIPGGYTSEMVLMFTRRGDVTAEDARERLLKLLPSGEPCTSVTKT